MLPPGNSQDHFLYFKNKILAGEPFSLIRPNDGEYMIMNKIVFNTQDIWGYDGKGCLCEDLRNAIQKMISLKNAYVGIPCKGCYDHIYPWVMNTFQIPADTLTYGNIFCNLNWKPFVSIFLEHKLPFHYIGPYKSNNYYMNVKSVFPVEELLVHTWDSKKDSIIRGVKEWASDKTGIFIFSAGPITKVLIPILVEQNPNNTYLDAGSSFDLFMKGSTNRGYINPNDYYTNIICDFQTGHTLKK